MENFVQKNVGNCVGGCKLCKVKLDVQIFDEDDVVVYCTHEKFVTKKTPDGKIIASNCRTRDIERESKVPDWCPMLSFKE